MMPVKMMIVVVVQIHATAIQLFEYNMKRVEMVLQ